ncbi:MAG: hypothetical protein ABEJ85_04035 [Haloarculaceae archaeon]
MLRIDGRVLTAAVVGLFLVGAGVGFFAGGGLGSGGPTDAGTEPGTPTAVLPPDESTPGDTPSPTSSATPTASPLPTPTVTPTNVLTPTPTATRTAVPEVTDTPFRTPMLVRRFDEGKIRRILVKLVNDWRAKKGLPRYHTTGLSMKRLLEMANNHSNEMADHGVVLHAIDNRSSADRYWEYNLYNTCKFSKHGADYVVTPIDNKLEVLAKTYAGKRYETDNETYRFNEDERAVATAIFREWKRYQPYRSRLLGYRNATHLAVGIEMTRHNEVYVTGNLCGISGFQREP